MGLLGRLAQLRAGEGHCEVIRWIGVLFEHSRIGKDRCDSEGQMKVGEDRGREKMRSRRVGI